MRVVGSAPLSPEQVSGISSPSARDMGVESTDSDWAGRRRSEGLEGLADRLRNAERRDGQSHAESDEEMEGDLEDGVLERRRRASQPLTSISSAGSATNPPIASAPAHRVLFDEPANAGEGERTKTAMDDPEAFAIGAVGGQDGVEGEEQEEDEGERTIQRFRGPMGKSGKAMSAVYSWMWETNFSPLGLIRRAGPLGPLLVGKVSCTLLSESSK